MLTVKSSIKFLLMPEKYADQLVALLHKLIFIIAVVEAKLQQRTLSRLEASNYTAKTAILK